MRTSKERLHKALHQMEDHLRITQLIQSTKTADELLTAIVAAKLKGFTFNERQTDMLDNEILKRRRNEVPRNDPVVTMALERIHSASEQGPDGPSDDQSPN